MVKRELYLALRHIDITGAQWLRAVIINDDDTYHDDYHYLNFSRNAGRPRITPITISLTLTRASTKKMSLPTTCPRSTPSRKSSYHKTTSLPCPWKTASFGTTSTPRTASPYINPLKKSWTNTNLLIVALPELKSIKKIWALALNTTPMGI